MVNNSPERTAGFIRRKDKAMISKEKKTEIIEKYGRQRCYDRTMTDEFMVVDDENDIAF